MELNFNTAFAESGQKSEISDEAWKLGWNEIVGGINGVPTAQQFNQFGYVFDKKANIAYAKAIEVANVLPNKANRSEIPTKTSDLTNDSGFIKSPDGGNADTLDGKHAADFANAYNLNIGEYLSGRSGDIRALAYLLPTGGLNVSTDAVPDVIFPLTGDLLLIWSKSLYTGNDLMYGTLMVRPMTADGDTYICSVFNGSRYTSWQKLSDGGNAATLGGKSASDFMEIAVTRGVLQTSLNNLVTPGVYGVQTGVTPDSPSGYGTWGLCEVRAFGSIIYQSIRYDTGIVINRAEINNQVDWSEWQRTNDGGNAASVGGAALQTDAGSIGLHQLSAGTAAATAANCPPGAWYGQYE